MVYLSDRVLLVARVLDEESDEPDEGVQSVETLCPHQGGAVVLLGQGTVAKVHAHLS